MSVCVQWRWRWGGELGFPNEGLLCLTGPSVGLGVQLTEAMFCGRKTVPGNEENTMKGRVQAAEGMQSQLNPGCETAVLYSGAPLSWTNFLIRFGSHSRCPGSV